MREKSLDIAATSDHLWLDTNTTLIWNIFPIGEFDYYTGDHYCKGMKQGFRLPTEQELRAIIEEGKIYAGWPVMGRQREYFIQNGGTDVGSFVEAWVEADKHIKGYSTLNLTTGKREQKTYDLDDRADTICVRYSQSIY